MSSSVATAAGAGATSAGAGDDDVGHAWEESTNAWENAVKEDADGNIIVAGGDSTADIIRKRRKRLEQNDYAQRNRRIVRDMIRYVYVLIDCSRWVQQKDPLLTPGTKLEVTIALLQEFVQEYYDQNPLSHLGFVTLRNGEAEILTNLSSSAKAHQLALKEITKMANGGHGGEFSLQNGLEVAGRSLGHQQRHGSREILIVCGALSTCDPGHILTETLPRLTAANIRVSTFALSAELHICRKISEATGGAIGVCLEKSHMKDWLVEQCVPPPAIRKESREDDGCEMVKMGFPTRSKSEIPTLVHATRDKKLLAKTAYACPQCRAKIQELPADCVVCGLKLVLSPHLARSFHHLFPVAPFSELPPPPQIQQQSGFSKDNRPVILDSKLRLSSSREGVTTTCFSCLRVIGSQSHMLSKSKADDRDREEEGEETLRYKCPDCKNVFCVNCDSYLHETLHNCPGCLLL